jgi:hypothetical protein
LALEVSASAATRATVAELVLRARLLRAGQVAARTPADR